MTPTSEIRGNLLAWIHDLETTDAIQGRVALRSKKDEYCALGRGVEVLGLGWEPHPMYDNRYTPTGDQGTYHFAADVGLDHKEMRRVYGMNDNGATFSEIASYLRAEILPRFPAEASVEDPSVETVLHAVTV